MGSWAARSPVFFNALTEAETEESANRLPIMTHQRRPRLTLLMANMLQPCDFINEVGRGSTPMGKELKCSRGRETKGCDRSAWLRQRINRGSILGISIHLKRPSCCIENRHYLRFFQRNVDLHVRHPFGCVGP